MKAKQAPCYVVRQPPAELYGGSSNMRPQVEIVPQLPVALQVLSAKGSWVVRAAR
jgi:hypothetical protein